MYWKVRIKKHRGCAQIVGLFDMFRHFKHLGQLRFRFRVSKSHRRIKLRIFYMPGYELDYSNFTETGNFFNSLY